MAERPRERASCLKRMGCCAGTLLFIGCVAAGITWALLVRMYGIRDDVGWIDSDRKRLPPRTAPVATPGNAYDAFLEATTLLSQPVEPVEPPGTVQPDWHTAVYHGKRPYIDVMSPAVQEIVRRNKLTLAKIHEAAARPICAVPSDDNIDTNRNLRALARLSNNAALLAHVQGDDAKALTHIEDCFVLSVACEQRDNAMAFLVGKAAGGIGAMTGRYVLAKGALSSERLRKHAAVVRGLRKQRVSLTEVESRWAQVAMRSYDDVSGAGLQERAREYALILQFDEDSSWSSTARSPLRLWFAKRGLGRSRVWTKDRYARRLGDQSQPLWVMDTDAMDARAQMDIRARSDLWAHVFVTDLASDVHRYQEYQATLLAEEVIACIEAYRGEHGVYPGGLADLVPGYMPELPIDPWTGKPLLYIRLVEGYKLYAAGPNKRDDGGLTDPHEHLGLDQVFVPVQTGTWDPSLPEVPSPRWDEGQPSEAPAEPPHSVGYE